MGVVEAKIQTVEDIYGLVWAAVAHRQPMKAIYKERSRLFCPHRLGRNQAGQRRVLCYQARQRIGAASSWRNFGRWNCWKVLGKPRRTIRVPPPAWSSPTSMPRINRSAIHKRDSEESASAGGGRGSFLRVVIEPGLCRSGRTRRATRSELRREFGGW